MIKTIKHKSLRQLYEKDESRGLPTKHIKKLRMILARLDEAHTIEDMNLVTFKLEALKGNYKGFWSVRVDKNWRITFQFHDGKASDVDYLDYH